VRGCARACAQEGHGYSARFNTSHHSSGPAQRKQFSSVPHIDTGGNAAHPRPGQLTWHANPEKTHHSTMVNHANRRTDPERTELAGKGSTMHTVHSTGPLGTLREPGVHDWCGAGRPPPSHALADARSLARCVGMRCRGSSSSGALRRRRRRCSELRGADERCAWRWAAVAGP
jgi:hypothetical protein